LEYFGKEVVKFTGEEVEQNYSFVFIKCKDTTIVIEGKCKNILLENCIGVTLVVDSVMTTTEVLNCKKLKIQIKEQCPQFCMERSDTVHLYLYPPAKGIKISSTCSQSMVIYYPKADAKEDDEWVDTAIPETYITVIKDDKLITAAADLAE